MYTNMKLLTKELNLFCSILYQIFCTLWNDDYIKHVYNNKHCSNFPGQFNQILIKKKKTYTNFIYKKIRLMLKFDPDVETYTCITTSTSL